MLCFLPVIINVQVNYFDLITKLLKQNFNLLSFSDIR